MIYSDADIRRCVGPSAAAAGEAYQRQGLVLAFEASPDGTIRARVQGQRQRPYDQTITLARSAAGPARIAGRCSCPMQLNCKHVAAALIEGLRRSRAMPPTAEARAARLIADGAGSAADGSRLAPGLPSDLAFWLDEVGRAQVTASEDYPAQINQRLVYVLAPVARPPRFAQLGVQPISIRLLKDGRFSDHGRNYGLEGVFSSAPAKFLRPSDHRILTALTRLRRGDHGVPSVLAREAAGPILADILATGRARWLAANGPALASGESRSGRITWQSHDGASVQPALEAGAGLVVLNATPPIYVDPVAGLVGPLETGLAPRIANALLDAPPVPVHRIAEVNAALLRRAPDVADLRLPEPRIARVVEEAPRPCLQLLAADLPAVSTPPSFNRTTSLYEAATERVALARLSFAYGPLSIRLGEAGPPTRLLDGELIEVRRDIAAERRHLATLLSLGLVPAAEHRAGTPKRFAHDLLLEGDDRAWLDLIYHHLPDLVARGWQTVVAEDFPFRIRRADGAITAEVHEGSGIDWFELGLGVLIDGDRVDLVGPLVRLLQSSSFDPVAFRTDRTDEPFYLALPDGQMLAMPVARLLPIVAAIAALAAGGLEKRGRLRLGAADAVGLAQFEAATVGLVWQGGERLRDMGRKLGTVGGIPPVTLPTTFRAALRPYQADGVAWLAFLREVGFGGVLADDMGLGKTVQALALIAIEKAAGRLDRPALVIAPTSLMTNWRLEAERFAPELRVLVLQGSDRQARFGQIAAHDLVLTTYPLVARDHETLSATPWHLLILDEAQTIKNPDAATTKLVAGLPARHRFGLTGTPMENHLGELWSLFSILLPGFLGDRQSFGRSWRIPIEKNGDVARGKLLARRVKPFLLRRTKEEVASDLPPKTEIVERVELQHGQRDIYESIRLSMHARVREAIAQRGFARSRIVILDALLKLRQACCDPRLLKLSAGAAGKAGSAKLERLMDMLVELRAEDRRILIFSQFTSMLALIRPRLDAAGVAYALLTGQTRDRAAAIGAFQTGGVPVFLVSLKAGGTGLNLTAADTVILYDPWWNPAAEDQAIDRAHRIGQDRPVFVHKLVATGTIEEKMEVMKDKKRALAESLFDHDGAPTLAMTEADLDSLLAP